MNPNYPYRFDGSKSLHEDYSFKLHNANRDYVPDLGRITLSNGQRARQHPVIRSLPPHEYRGEPEEVIIHPGIARRYRDRALRVSGVAKIYESCEFTVDKEVGSFGIRMLMKKSKADQVGIKLSNFGFKLSSKIGKDGGESKMLAADIQEKAAEYQKISPHDPKARLRCLRELGAMLERYYLGLPDGLKLRKSVLAMRDFVAAAAIELEHQLESVNLNDLGRDWLDDGGYLGEYAAAELYYAMCEGSESQLNATIDKLTPLMFSDLKRGGATWEKFASGSCWTFKRELLERLAPGDDLRGALQREGRLLMVEQALNRLYAAIVNGLASKDLLTSEELASLSRCEIEALQREGGPETLSTSLQTVVMGCRDSEGNAMVVKEPVFDLDATELEAQQLAWDSYHELIIHSRLPEHENLVRLMGAYHNGVGNVLCLERCSGGTSDVLMDRINGYVQDPGFLPPPPGRNKARLRQNVLKVIFSDALKGMVAVRSSGHSHGNPCLHNIFLKGGVAKMGNFKTGLNAVAQGRYYPLSTDMHFPRPGGGNDIPELAPFYAKLDREARLIQLLNGGVGGDLDELAALCTELDDDRVRFALEEAMPGLLKLQKRLDKGEDLQAMAGEWTTVTTDLLLAVTDCLQIPRQTGQSVDLSKCDVWLLGLAMAQAFFPGGAPIVGQTDQETRNNLNALAALHGAEAGLVDLLVGMLAQDPSARIPMRQAVDDEFFREMPGGDVRAFMQAIELDAEPGTISNLADSVITGTPWTQLRLLREAQQVDPNVVGLIEVDGLFELPDDLNDQ